MIHDDEINYVCNGVACGQWAALCSMRLLNFASASAPWLQAAGNASGSASSATASARFARALSIHTDASSLISLWFDGCPT